MRLTRVQIEELDSAVGDIEAYEGVYWEFVITELEKYDKEFVMDLKNHATENKAFSWHTPKKAGIS